MEEKKTFGEWIDAVEEASANSIPEMTDPLGKYWEQPDRKDITVRKGYAEMSQATFEKLKNYSHTTPTGVYDGKMWRMEEMEPGFLSSKGTGRWFIRWYDKHPTDSNKCVIESREIRIIQ